MNRFNAIPATRHTTQAAEGMPRWAWTLAEFDRFIELGVIGEDDRVELIGGELVPMAAKGNRHELVKTELVDWIYRRLPNSLRLSIELGWRPGNDTYIEPDLVVFAKCADPSAVQATEALLVIEVAASSLDYDQGRKAEIYAALGVRDYWVINAQTLVTRVHREPSQAGFGAISDIAPADEIVPLYLNELPVMLASLEIGEV